MNNRAYVALSIKAVDDDARRIEGWASTAAPDRAGDIVMPKGATYALPLPFLLDHDHKQVVGEVDKVEVTAKGIRFWAHIKRVAEQGEVQALCDKAWALVKNGLRRSVSIGFRPIEYERLSEGGLKFTSWEWLELSAVGVPANAEAQITSIKSFDPARRYSTVDAPEDTIKSIDRDALAASGRERGPDDRRETPAASGTKGTSPITKQRRAIMPKTIAEQIAAFEAKRAANEARVAEIMQKSAEELTTLDEADETEHDELTGEIEAIDKHLARLRKLEKLNVEKATPASGKDNEEGSQSRGGIRVEVKKADLPKGTAFTRYVMALAAARGNRGEAVQIAKRWDDSTPEVGAVLKAAVDAGTTTDSTWAAPLVEYQTLTSEFAEFLRPQTIVGRIPGLRRVPFNVKIGRTTGASTAAWVGEGAPKPVSEMAFDQITLGSKKIAGIVVLTEELVRQSSPAAEAIVRQDLADTIVQLMDRDFIDPAKAAVSGVSPASILNGVTPVVASGTDADAVRADINALYAKFVAANLSVAGSVFIMRETTALRLAMMYNALGQPEFPGLSITGGTAGTLMGLPVILSENIPANAGTGSPVTGDGDRIALVKASEILYADDGQTMIDASREASLQMDSAPTNPPTSSTVFVSMFQSNLVAIRAERILDWGKRRPGAAQYIDAVKYG